MGVIRVVLIRFTPSNRSKGQHQAVIDAAREVFPTIPGVVDFEAGAASPPDEWDLVLLVHFADMAQVERYRQHPIHVGFVDTYLKPRVERLDARNFIV